MNSHLRENIMEQLNLKERRKLKTILILSAMLEVSNRVSKGVNIGNVSADEKLSRPAMKALTFGEFKKQLNKLTE